LELQMQNMNSAPGRNQFKAAAKPSKVSVPSHSTTVTAKTADGGNGPTPGKAVVKGFTGSGTLKAKI
jgi:hypothetical protein